VKAATIGPYATKLMPGMAIIPADARPAKIAPVTPVIEAPIVKPSHAVLSLSMLNEEP
jgi:hypothetical protein